MTDFERDAIAIIGMAGRFPGARSVSELWENLKNGVESIRRFSREELLKAGVAPSLLDDPDYVKAGAPLEDADCFDADFFGITPREAALMDPQHRLFLECAWSALEDAGYDPDRFEGLIGVFGGVARNTYFLENVEAYRRLIESGALYEATLASEKDFPATRVSYKLNLKGPSLNLQLACSTSGVAVHLACQSLLNGECDMALAGGFRVQVPLIAGYRYVDGGIASPDGHCRAFDARARGCVVGNGGALVVLRRLDDALADGDRIDAVILGSAINNDGSAKAGFTAPSVEGQARVIEEALAVAGVPADSIGYVEAHGTGTALGDPVEVAALTRAYGSTSEPGYCAIGSIKTNIGHLDAGAGVAGLIKVVLALKHRQIPPSLHFEHPNPEIDFESSPFRVNTRLRQWDSSGVARRAGVSSFGIGGTNVHLVLQEFHRHEKASESTAPQLLPVSARTPEALDRAAANLSTALGQNEDLSLADAAYTLAVGRRAFEHRHVVVSDSPDEVAAKLAAPDRLIRGTPENLNPPVVFMFPGQGAQHAGMGGALYENETTFRHWVDRGCELARTELDFDLLSLLQANPEDPEAAKLLNQTQFAQPALFIVEYALARLWADWGIEPAAMIGHSVGEFAAACLSGIFSFEDTIKLVILRGRLMQEQAPGSMVAVRGSLEDLQPYLSPAVSLAASNAPRLQVLSGPTPILQQLVSQLNLDGFETRELQTSHAFHSEMMVPAVEPFRELVETVPRSDFSIPFVSTLTGDWICAGNVDDSSFWARQIASCVQFCSGIDRLLQSADHVFLEVGPGTTLSTLVRQHPRGAGRSITASLGHPAENRSARSSFLEAVGRLWVAGSAIDWSPLHRKQQRNRLGLPGYPFERSRHWLQTSGEDLSESDRRAPTDSSVQPGGESRIQSYLDSVKKTLHDLSGIPIDDIGEHQTFLDLGFDSLFLTQATLAFKQAFGVPVTFRDLMQDAPTPGRLADFIAARLPADDPGTATAPEVCEGREAATEPPELSSRQAHGPWKPVSRGECTLLTQLQRDHLRELTSRYTLKTGGSQRLAQTQRKHLADPRSITGFHRHWKNMVYQLAFDHARGSRLWDVDGNEYVDLVMGFGINLFGHSPAFVKEAIEDQLGSGYPLGVLSPKGREVADLLCDTVGIERVNFVNTGSEAVSAAVRAARTVTGRHKIAVFSGDYHGIADELLVRAIESSGGRRPLPVAPGIPETLVQNVLVLDYEDDQVADTIASHAHELAAVIVEPVPASRPGFPMAAVISKIRHLCTTHDIALIFDELITAFRLDLRGAQGYYGVEADLVSYGKVLSGGLPLAAVGGKSRFMDAFDGGQWNYGDDSFPEAGVTFFGGTFVRHPLSLRAAEATLLELRRQGSGLQQELTRRTGTFVQYVASIIEDTAAPLSIEHGGSMLLLKVTNNDPLSRLFFFHMREKGVHVTERAGFLSTAHTDEDLDYIAEAIQQSISLMQMGGCFPEGRRPSTLLNSQAAGELILPLTEAQQEMWLSAAMSPEQNASYNLSNAIDLTGRLNVNALRDSIQALVDRHDALRTGIDPDGETQRVKRRVEIRLPLIDLRDLSDEDLEAQVTAVRTQEVETPFDLAAPPLLRCRLLRLDDDQWLLLLTVHHIICDGYSCGTLLRELASLYSARTADLPVGLGGATQFSEHVRDQDSDERRARRREAENYWLDQFNDGVPVLDLPTDRVRPARRTYNAAREHRTLTAVDNDLLKKVSAANQCTPFATMLAAFGAFLHRLADSQDLVVGVVAAGQVLDGDNTLVGNCVNLLPTRLRVDPGASFGDLAQQVQCQLLEAFANRECTFGTLIRELKVERTPSRPPLVSVIFNMDHTAGDLAFGDLDVQAGSTPRRYENFEVFFNFIQEGPRIRLECTYNTDLHSRDSMRRRLAEFECLLAHGLAAPQECVSQLSTLPADQKQLVLYDWNQTSRPSPKQQLLHRLIEAQVQRAPERIAVADENGRITYSELEARATRLARRLRHRGIGVGSLVGVCMDRDLDMVIALLGVLKTGAAYVPLDPALPMGRISYILGDCGANLLVSGDRTETNLSQLNIDTLFLENETPDRDGSSLPLETDFLSPEDPAYVIYTSGSSGQPKGVRVPHRAIVNLLSSMAHTPGMSEDDVLLAVTTLGFDIAGLEVFLPLICGGRLVVATRAETTDPSLLISAIERSRATILQATPTTWRLLLEAGWKGRKQLKALVGGEALPRELVAPLLVRCRELWNMYGPTETTVWSTVERIRSADEVIGIGRPIDNTSVYVLDRHGQPVSVDVPGELYIGGQGLALGYVNREDLTRSKFVPHPLAPAVEGRVYRTGDRVRWSPDGRLEFLGRLDSQLKIRGFRVEPAEVESALLSHPGVKQGAVALRKVSSGDDRLVGYYVPTVAGRLDEAELRAHLRQRLPEYMLPQHWVRLDGIRTNANGKIDRAALPDRIEAPASPGAESPRLLASSLARVRDREKPPRPNPGLDSYPGVEHRLNRLCTAHILNYFRSAGLTLQPGTVIKRSTLQSALGITAGYERFLESMTGMLVEDDLVQRDGDSLTITQAGAVSNLSEQEAAITARFPEFSGLVQLLRRCADHLPQVLSGRVPGVRVLFPDGTRNFLDRKLSEETVTFKDIGVYEDLACALVESAAARRPLRILEIGGGSGLLTWQLTGRLAHFDIEYVFTDVGPSLVRAAEQRAAREQLSFMSFDVLDISADVTAQGFRAHQFDVVIGLNVVHATPDVAEALKQCRTLLKEDGFLCLVEYSRCYRWDTLIWGLTEGWWHFEDQYRSDAPLLPLDRWCDVLSDCGFTHIEPFPRDRAHQVAADAGLIAASPASARDSIAAVGREETSPGDQIERVLLNLWKSVLGIRRLGLQDNFFDLGGHSVLAVRLMSRMEAIFGHRFPLALLLEAPTIRQLAQVLREGDRAPRWESLVALREGGAAPPLFLMHSHGGNILEYQPLASHLEADQPVYALQARGLDGHWQEGMTIEEMAATYIREILGIQPDEPYYLAGFCFGGLLALEAARQLESMGRTVAFVGLIQTTTTEYPRFAEGTGSLKRVAFRLARRLDLEWTSLRQTGAAHLRDRCRRLADVLRLWSAVATERVLHSGPARNGRRSLRYSLHLLAREHERAAAAYRPITPAAPLTLFRARKQPPGVVPDPSLGWAGTCNGNLTWHDLPGHQENLLKEPNVTLLANKLTATLSQARSRERERRK